MKIYLIVVIVVFLVLMTAAWMRVAWPVWTSAKNDRMYYFANGKRKSGKLIKKGFFRSYVRDYTNLKVYGVMNSDLRNCKYE
jgi:hypothetical protein